ncbi:MAG: HD domain-containing protein [Clostridiales bacterium]|nr:HD domain-containing protein [Clostridiales bacterium]
MDSLFDIFGDELGNIPSEPHLIDNYRDAREIELIRNEREKNLSPFAMRTEKSRGRKVPEEPCTIRSPYERDLGRIIFSQSFRRLRHKTQVFFNPVNDHICSRIEHVIYVNYISTIIGRALNLNIDLIQAIALGHDIGHSPYGHTGERVLNRCIKSVDPSLYFEHEVHSLRVLDVLEEHRPGQYGLNLTFEVRDGIVSHCGETYDEFSLTPYREKTEKEVSDKPEKDRTRPSTLEGCVVRFADKIAYVGRDIEDARRAGIIGGNDFVSSEAARRLGTTNSEIINILVGDIVHNSLNKDEICMSRENFEAMNEYLNANLNEIYLAPKIKTYENMVKLQIEAIFEAFMESLDDIEKAEASNNEAIKSFAKFYIRHPQPECPPVRKVVDYIAGMTDTYANACFDELYRV